MTAKSGDEKRTFRFQKLEIWKKAKDIGHKLLDVADQLEKRKLYRFAEQVRGASLSISNNIAEGSGSTSKRDFAHFLNIARRSAFENANMAIVFYERGIIEKSKCNELLQELDEVCRMITGFSRNLKS